MVLQNGAYQCLSCDPKYNIKADGTDQPVQGSKSIRTEAIKVVDNKTVEMTTKIGGKVFILEKVTVSADGKMRTEETLYQAGKEPRQVKATYIRVAPVQPDRTRFRELGGCKSQSRRLRSHAKARPMA